MPTPKPNTAPGTAPSEQAGRGDDQRREVGVAAEDAELREHRDLDQHGDEAERGEAQPRRASCSAISAAASSGPGRSRSRRGRRRA